MKTSSTEPMDIPPRKPGGGDPRARRPIETEFGEELEVEASRTRARRRLAGRERWASVVVGVSFCLVALPLAAEGVSGDTSWGLVAVYAVAYAIVSRIEFEVGQGSGIPTELVLVPMLFALPPRLAPACVAAGLLLGAVPDILGHKLHRARVFVVLCSSWHAVGPALVLWQLAPATPRLSAWPVYLLALAAQFVFDFAAGASRHWFGRRVSPRQLVPSFAWIFTVDSVLAPIALLAALHVRENQFEPLLLVPLAGLLRLVAHDRRRRIDRSLELGRAYVDAHEAARTDPLTGVRNRLAWDELLDDLASPHAPRPFTILLVDVDNLKTANDSFGHDFGDRVIRTVARAIGDGIREDDVVARIGGDEFAVFAPGIDGRAAPELIDRVQDAVAARLRLDGFAVSVSIGHASSPPAATVADVLAAADAAMYETKALTRPVEIARAVR